MNPPVLMVVAGPNGSGKSTITERYKPIGSYINADDIQRHLNCEPLKAAQIAEATREYLLSKQENFTFETVLSTPRNLKLMLKAKKYGYRVVCIYILTKDPNINISRVKARAAKGQHYVEPGKIVERYKRAMVLFPELFDICDELYVYDNSLERSDGKPQRIISMQGKEVNLFPNDVWSADMIKSLCDGTYTKEGNNKSSEGLS